MRLDSAVLIFTSVVLSASSQILLKRGMVAREVQDAIQAGGITDIALTSATSPSVISGFGCLGLATVLWLFILTRVPLSSAYPFVALGILVTVVAGAIMFSEPISLAKAIGVILIIMGVIMVGITG